MQYIITFKNQMDAIATKKVFKKNKLKIALKPLPLSLSNDCGICAYTTEKIDSFINVLTSYREIYAEESNKYVKISL